MSSSFFPMIPWDILPQIISVKAFFRRRILQIFFQICFRNSYRYFFTSPPRTPSIISSGIPLLIDKEMSPDFFTDFFQSFLHNCFGGSSRNRYRNACRNAYRESSQCFLRNSLTASFKNIFWNLNRNIQKYLFFSRNSLFYLSGIT